MKKTVLFLVGLILVLVLIRQLVIIISTAKISTQEQRIKNEVQSNMIAVETGSFEMGDKNAGGDEDAKPPHRVILDDFMMSKYDVTQGLWKAVMGNNPSGSTKCDSCPVEKVSWNDAQKFISKLNSITGQRYRLPFEAEWEYAAKGGSRSKGSTFSGGNEIDSVGWNDSNSEKKTHPIGQKKANELCLYDMTGNVLQWCSDWYDYNYYNTSPEQNPHGPGRGKTKVLRGGGWNIYTAYCGVTVRADLIPDSCYYNVGFRLARDPLTILERLGVSSQ